MTYVGLVVGANKGDFLNLSALGGIFGGERPAKKVYKILDTSVIIDGRIADICETGFLDGILRDSAFRPARTPAGCRFRGCAEAQSRPPRPGYSAANSEDGRALPCSSSRTTIRTIREVDMKLIELAKEFEAKIVTNDFNLNKVAQLRGVEVLNINELANALKPVYLPGETMKVFILKEGKEFNQGIAYLDDGTMVVVDNARKMIGKTIESSVTSVLQTTAGKMIFGTLRRAARRSRSSSGAKEDRPDAAASSDRSDRSTGRPALRRRFRTSRSFMKVTAIIAAAGAGRRMKTDRPKQLLTSRRHADSHLYDS